MEDNPLPPSVPLGLIDFLIQSHHHFPGNKYILKKVLWLKLETYSVFFQNSNPSARPAVNKLQEVRKRDA